MLTLKLHSLGNLIICLNKVRWIERDRDPWESTTGQFGLSRGLENWTLSLAHACKRYEGFPNWFENFAFPPPPSLDHCSQWALVGILSGRPMKSILLGKSAERPQERFDAKQIGTGICILWTRIHSVGRFPGKTCGTYCCGKGWGWDLWIQKKIGKLVWNESFLFHIIDKQISSVQNFLRQWSKQNCYKFYVVLLGV